MCGVLSVVWVHEGVVLCDELCVVLFGVLRGGVVWCVGVLFLSLSFSFQLCFDPKMRNSCWMYKNASITRNDMRTNLSIDLAHHAPQVFEWNRWKRWRRQSVQKSSLKFAPDGQYWHIHCSADERH